MSLIMMRKMMVAKMPRIGIRRNDLIRLKIGSGKASFLKSLLEVVDF